MHNIPHSNYKKLELSSQKYLLNSKVQKEEDQHEYWSYSFNGKESFRHDASHQYSSIKSKKEEDGLYELSHKQKEMIANLSKVFLSQNPHPKKILVKINEMKRCHLKDQHTEDCPNCRIDRIQISTLPQSYQSSDSKFKNQFKNIPEISDVVLDLKIPEELQSSIIEMNDISSSLEKPKSQKQQLRILKTVAITYRPQKPCTDTSRCRSVNQVTFSKFRQPLPDSLQSNASINNQTLFDQLNAQSTRNSKEINFTKLFELNSFVKRKCVEKQLLTVSNAANEKINNQYKNLKSQVNSERTNTKHQIQQLTQQLSKVKSELQLQRKAHSQLKQQLEGLQKKLKDLRQINETFLKENNTLKEKLKQNMKVIQDFRREINKQSNMSMITEDRHRTNSPQITRLSEKMIQEAGKKPISIVHYQNQNKQTEKPKKSSKGANEVQNNYLSALILQLSKQGHKTANVRSTHILSRGYEGQADEREIPSKEASVKSQRVIGIRKNSPAVDPNVMQKNLVKVASYSEFDNHNNTNVIYAKNDRDNKSLSGCSNFSGSLSQRVGFIQKPITEAKRGMLVDYMLQDMVEKNNLQVKPPNKGKKEEKEKPINIRVNEVQRERFQYRQSK